MNSGLQPPLVVRRCAQIERAAAVDEPGGVELGRVAAGTGGPRRRPGPPARRTARARSRPSCTPRTPLALLPGEGGLGRVDRLRLAGGVEEGEHLVAPRGCRPSARTSAIPRPSTAAANSSGASSLAAVAYQKSPSVIGPGRRPARSRSGWPPPGGPPATCRAPAAATRWRWPGRWRRSGRSSPRRPGAGRWPMVSRDQVRLHAGGHHRAMPLEDGRHREPARLAATGSGPNTTTDCTRSAATSRPSGPTDHQPSRRAAAAADDERAARSPRRAHRAPRPTGRPPLGDDGRAPARAGVRATAPSGRSSVDFRRAPSRCRPARRRPPCRTAAPDEAGGGIGGQPDHGGHGVRRRHAGTGRTSRHGPVGVDQPAAPPTASRCSTRNDRRPTFHRATPRRSWGTRSTSVAVSPSSLAGAGHLAGGLGVDHPGLRVGQQPPARPTCSDPPAPTEPRSDRRWSTAMLATPSARDSFQDACSHRATPRFLNNQLHQGSRRVPESWPGALNPQLRAPYGGFCHVSLEQNRGIGELDTRARSSKRAVS